MTTTTTAPVWEPSAWLRGRLSRITAQAEPLRLATHAAAALVPLGRPGAPGSREDRTCDRCGRYVPLGGALRVLTVRVQPWLYVFGGLCASCFEAEGVPQ